jgi:hypothetical protein
MRVETSIMTSLDELRAIQQQRIADEKASFERERQAEAEARRAAEQARVAAEDAKLREQRDAMLRIEQARVAAEREVRLRVEAAEAAEHTRLQLQLEEQRRMDEMDLRRAEVAKKRPTWMLAVTGLAVCAGLALTWFAVQRAHDAEAANAATDRAQRARELAMAELQQSRDELAKIQSSLDQFEGTLVAAQKAVGDAQTDADRKRAALVAQEAARKEHEIRVQLDLAHKHQEDLIRKNGLDMAKCAATATGCLDKIK